jgi:tetratricopeptide (TPR) repeat protein
MGPRFIRLSAALMLAARAATPSAQAPADRPQALFDRAIADFRSGRIAESVAAFDTLAQLLPGRAPGLWQRGIALYYAGRYSECRAQFESHRTVNPDDVENAAWHFACVARGETPDRARAALLPVGPDSRRPMREIYQLLRGTLTPEQVLAAAGGQLESQFYAHLYVGLYFEAFRNSAGALEHITLAADDRYEAAGGYMHTVARIHREILQRAR